MPRVGVLGGSFNPVHQGHLLLARAAQKSLKLDRVLFVPCAQSADKKKLLPAALRLRMLRAALRGQEKFSVSAIEIRKGGVSRSVDTLRALKKKYPPSTQFFLLLGQDQASRFERWKEPLALSKLAKISVMKRSGFSKKSLIHKKYGFITLKVSPYEISSSQIRSRLKQSLALENLMPAPALSIFKTCRRVI